jgi:fatty acid desaturase
MDTDRTRTDRVVDAIGRRIPELLGVGVLAIAVWAAPWWLAALVAVPLVWVFYTEIREHRTDARTAAVRGGPHRRIAATEPADDEAEPGEGERSA